MYKGTTLDISSSISKPVGAHIGFRTATQDLVGVNVNGSITRALISSLGCVTMFSVGQCLNQ